jgi:hypothetical protein
MPVGYSKYLMPSLAERLQDFLTGGDYQEQLRLYEEIALARTLLSKDLELKSMADRVGVQQLGFFVEQITRVIYQRLGPENEELAKQLAVDLKERVKLPADPDHDPNVVIDVSYD